MNEQEIGELNLKDYKDDSEEGLILDVCLEYPPELASCLLTNPTELHDFHIEITPWKMHAFDFYSRVEFSDTTQRVNKIRTKHFPWCNLFIL